MADSKQGSPVTGLVTLLVAGFVLYSCLGGEEKTQSPEEVAAKAAEEAENKRKGFHCLSSWDGSHSDFKRAVTDSMREPDSFEHIETRVTPIDADGNHSIFMQYRARNGFGGMNVGTAIGTFKNSDCSFIVLSIE